MKPKRSNPAALATSPSLTPQTRSAPTAPIRGAQVAATPRIQLDPELYENEPEIVDPAAQAEARAKAFSARYQFAGTALQPFTKSRERLLLDIRGASGAGELGRMDTLFGDALRFTWLCLQTGQQLESFQAGVGLPGLNSWPLYRRFQIAIDRWSETNSEIVSANREAMVDTFLDAWRDSQITHAIPEAAATAGDDDSGN